MRLLPLLFAVALYGQTPATPVAPAVAPPTMQPLDRTASLELENYAMRINLLQVDLEKTNDKIRDLAKQYTDKVAAVCAAAKIPQNDCNVARDPRTETWTITRRQPDKKEEPKK